MYKIKVLDIAIIAILSSLLIVQELVLQFLPNIQLTVFLIVLFSKKLKMVRTIIIVTIYTLFDCLFASSLNLFYFPFMLIGWNLIPILLSTIFKRVENSLYLAFLGILFSLLYSWIFIIPTMVMTDVKFLDYLVSDLVFEGLLAISSFLSILWLYYPCSKLLDKILKKPKEEVQL